MIVFYISSHRYALTALFTNMTEFEDSCNNSFFLVQFFLVNETIGVPFRGMIGYYQYNVCK